MQRRTALSWCVRALAWPRRYGALSFQGLAVSWHARLHVYRANGNISPTMIASFADQATEDIFNGSDTKAARKTLSKELWDVAFRKLQMIEAANDVADLRIPPGNQLEKLKGNLAGMYSIRINKQYRIIFHFESNQATTVQITDYH